MEEKIVAFLRKKYKPKVILLVGSRARGEATHKSDWDLLVYTAEKKKVGRGGNFNSFRGEKLDLSLYAYPFSKNAIVKNNFSPIPRNSLKVLHDHSNGALKKVLDRTEKAYAKGPLKLRFWKEDHRRLLQTMERQIEKTKKYEYAPEIQFIYKSAFYEFSIPAYFQERNLWTPPPVKTFEYFSVKDKKFASLLKKLREVDGKPASQCAEAILRHIRSVRK